jgi:hypothetical protein
MPEQKRKMNLLGHDTEVTDVPIKKSNETWNEYELEDGSVIRFKSTATGVLRLDQHTPDGNPVYLVLNGQVVTVIHAPEHLRKKT